MFHKFLFKKNSIDFWINIDILTQISYILIHNWNNV